MTAGASRYRNAFWILLAVATLARLVLAGRFGLSTDEAHYVLYGRHLAFGYFDHPPMVGFLGALSGLSGGSAFSARLGPILCWAGATVLLRRLLIALYREERIALAATVVMLCIPMVQLLSLALLPDATLNLFWMGALLAAWHALRSDRWGWWLLSGAFFGLSLLSKYHGVLLPACLFCFLLLSAEDRPKLHSLRPWTAWALGLLVFLPNVLWNSRHGWISYAYQLGRGGEGLDAARLLENIAGQLAASSPVILVLLVAAWIALIRERPWTREDLYLLCTSLPVFALFWAVGLKSKLLPHWTSVGWWTGSAAIVVVALRGIDAGGARGRRWRRGSIAGCALGFGMSLLLFVLLALPVAGPLYAQAQAASVWLHERVPAVEALEPRKGADPFYGWDQAAQRIEQVRAAMPDPGRTFVFSDRFYTISSLAVYFEPGTVPTTLRGEDQYRLWFDPGQHRGWDALFVDDERFLRGVERYADWFRETDPVPIQVEILRNGWPARVQQVYRCYGFVGTPDR